LGEENGGETLKERENMEDLGKDKKNFKMLQNK
jgi:hypothetical protein